MAIRNKPFVSKILTDSGRGGLVYTGIRSISVVKMLMFKYRLWVHVQNVHTYSNCILCTRDRCINDYQFGMQG